MRPLKIAEGIYDVGVKDWNIRDFHGYSTSNGTTYNAFLIVDEKVVLIDTVKKGFGDELLKNISAVIDPKKIDFVVSNHAEMDHSGCLPQIMHVIGQEKPVYCSKMGEKNLKSHFQRQLNYQVVPNGSSMSIGKRTLNFMETRMLHWPDSMFTYIPEDKILFSSDAFGQHYAGHENFDDETGTSILGHAKKYYANILLLYAPKVKALIESVVAAGLDIKTICPDHGIIWRKDPGAIITKYMEWSDQAPTKKAVVLYDTMWNSTEKMAEAITSGLNAAGVEAIPMHVRKWHRSDIMTEIMDARAVIVGSPTLNNGLYPTLCDVLTYVKGLKPMNKIGASFGSYGWSGEAVKLLNAELTAMGMELINDGLKMQYVPDTDQLKTCFEFGKSIAEKI
ncbi:MAG: flavodoxin domain-containing protein [Proteobacteria bacterium]|nr:flavodoxin domain-containing protein [Pseudomonadota bacterium]